jgi:hypothetical protein
LTEHDRIQVVLLSGCRGTEGNEKAWSIIGAEAACSKSAEVAKKAVRDWTNEGHKKHWESIIGSKTCKGFSSRTSLQKGLDTIRIVQEPAEMGYRNMHRVVSPERSPFRTEPN